MLSKIEKYHHLWIFIFYLNRSLKKFKQQHFQINKSALPLPLCHMHTLNISCSCCCWFFTLYPHTFYFPDPFILPLLTFKFTHQSRPLLWPSDLSSLCSFTYQTHELPIMTAQIIYYLLTFPNCIFYCNSTLSAQKP